MFLAALASLPAVMPPVYAEIVPTRPGVYQSSDKTLKVVVSHRTPGIFVLRGPEIELQLFDPAELSLPGGDENERSPYVHAFIEYDPTSDRYSRLHLGRQSLRINGGFTMLLQDFTEGNDDRSGGASETRLTVDNTNPYLSIVHESSASAASDGRTEPLARAPQTDILGFRGLQAVVRKSGQRYVALLEANQFNHYKGLIEPYTLASNGLSFKGQPFSGSFVGVELEPARNPCLDRSASVISRGAAEGLKHTADRNAALRSLEELLKQGSSHDPFKGALILRIEKDEIIALDYRRDKAMVVRPLTENAQVVCIAEEISLQ